MNFQLSTCLYSCRWAFFSILAVCLSISGISHAQRIDFDLNNNNSPTASSYTQWIITSFPLGSSCSGTFGDLTITLSHGEGTKGQKIKANWYKQGIQQGDDNMKLISDGITSKTTDNDGEHSVPSGRVAIKVTVSGLTPGEHTVEAYHNNVDFTPGMKTMPPIGVDVNGTTLISGVAQSFRATDITTCAKTFITFNVVSADTPVEITYYTEPAEGVTYDCTEFYINSLDFDVAASGNKATDPSPSNEDYHVACDNGSLELTFNPAANSPTQHTIYVSDDYESVADGSAPAYTSTSASLTLNGLSPLKHYYWRVDETINGVTFKGEIWSFQPRRDAFPGAEGYGRYAIGGRGGTVYHVTSLDDDPTNPIEGTFRYGITQVKGPRTIVFDVSGEIVLQTRLTCGDPYVTIAGQTAPGKGILLRGCPFGMASDGITRFMRLRLGHEAVNGHEGNDGMGMAGNDHSIMDHCSISWTIDEAFSSRSAKHITLQRTLISEALNVAGHPNYSPGTKHGYAATIGGGELGAIGSSYHHNLLAHNEGRNWSMSGGLDANGYYDGHHDMFNNVVYNWGSRTCDGGTHEGQFVNNYYKMGKASTQKKLLTAQIEGTGDGTQSYYVKGNVRENLDGTLTNDARGVTYDYTTSNNQVVDWTVFKDTPFFDSHATVETAQAAFRNVLSDVGCNQPGLDNHDIRMIDETLNGTTSTTSSYDNVADGLIDCETDSGCEGFQGLGITNESRAADWDTDQDGIPNWFEEVMGWSTSTPDNNECDDATSYYTHLEEYLNWMAEPHLIGLGCGQTTNLDLRSYFAGYDNASYSFSSNDVAVSISGSTLSITPSVSGLTSISITATQGSVTLTRTLNLYVKEAIAFSPTANWATYCSAKDLSFETTDAIPYIIVGMRKNANGTITSLIQAVPNGIVPAYTGILVKKGTMNEVTPGFTTSGGIDLSSNLLIGVTEATHIEQIDGNFTNFVLAKGVNGIGFYIVADQGGTIKSNKAYLQLPTAKLGTTSHPANMVFIEEDATAINEVEDTADTTDTWYSLSGMRITQPVRKGIYIHNGRKVVVN